MDDGDSPSPFGGMPFFGDLGKLFGAGGGDQWSTAKQLAVQMASGGVSEPNVDPGLRIELEQLARVAELQISQATGLDVSGVGVAPVTRAVWADTAINDFKAIFEKLSASLSANAMPDSDQLAGDPMGAMFGQMMQMMGPMMLSMTAGSMVGHMAQRSLGHYDIPVPRGEGEIQVVATNIEAFGDEWSLPLQDLLLWICLHELTHYAVLNVDHVRDTMFELLLEYAGGFTSDPTALESQLEGLDLSNPDALASLQNSLADPEVILGAIQSPEQQAMLPRLHALTAVVVGYVDHIMDSIGSNLIGSYAQLTEALRRRRVEADQADRFIERMLGLELTQEQYDRGAAFVDGVVERSNQDALAKLWESVDTLPTANEVDAPGLWLARMGVEAALDGDDADLLDDLEIPDDVSGLE